MWGRRYWEQIYEVAISCSIAIGHVAAHQKNSTQVANMANHTASINVAGFSSTLSVEWLGKWLHEWLGYTGACDLY